MKKTTIITGYEIIFVIISFDSKTAITLLKDTMTQYFVRLYDLESEFYV